MDNATVKKIEGGYAFIEMEINTGCRNCENKAVCMAGDKPALIRIGNDLKLSEGDRIELDIPPKEKITAGFLLFILPLLFLITGYYVGYSIKPEETAGIIGAVIGFAIGLSDIILLQKFLKKTSYLKPRSVRKIS